MRKAKKFDVIVIGSGIGGLISGALLSKNKRVLLIEKEHNFGGYCSSFKRNNFCFEAATEAINGLKRGAAIEKLFKNSCGISKTEFVKTPYLYRSIYPDYDIRVPQNNISEYKNLLVSLFEEEKNGIESLFKEMAFVHDELEMMDRKKTMMRCPYVMKYYGLSAEAILNKYISNERLKTIISQYWVYCGLPPKELDGVLFSYIWYEYTCNGSYYPKSGMKAIVNKCVETIKNNGGSVINNSKVTRILNEGNAVNGVELANKKKYFTDFLVSNIDINKTFEMLSERNDKVLCFLKKLKGKETSISAFRIYLGLDIDVKIKGIKDYEIFVNPSYKMNEMYAASIKNDVDNSPVSIVIYSNLSKNFCENGKSVLSITILSGYDFWKNLSKHMYDKIKSNLANKLIERCEAIIPDLKDYIKVKIIATPLTMERYTGNRRGAIYGWNKHNMLDEIRFFKVSTPVDNLFLASHWTKLGGGVTGVMRAAVRACNMIEGKNIY